MSETADPQTRVPGIEAVVQRWTQWFGAAEQTLLQQRQALEGEREALRLRLKDLGLDTPEAIQAAWRDMDASERQALAQQAQSGLPVRAEPDGAPPRRNRLGGFI